MDVQDFEPEELSDPVAKLKNIIHGILELIILNSVSVVHLMSCSTHL